MTANNPSNIKRVIFKEIVDGDLRKFQAQSNDSPTGGGARDLRFSPYAQFREVFSLMLPHHTPESFNGTFTWYDANRTLQTGRAIFMFPTNARPNEGRITNVDKYLPMCPYSIDEGPIFLIIVQDITDTNYVSFATHSQLISDWHPIISNFIINLYRTKRPDSITVSGYLDFERGINYGKNRR